MKNSRIISRSASLLGIGGTAAVVLATSAFATGNWSPATLSGPSAPTPFSNVMGYSTALTGQTPRARVVYETPGGHIVELSSTGTATSWSPADLTEMTGAPPPDMRHSQQTSLGPAPYGYTTNLPDQGPVARVVYTTEAGHIEELSSTDGTHWVAADLNLGTGAPLAGSAPMGYTTDLNNQGPVARVVYTTEAGHIEELSLARGGTPWSAADLTVAAGAPSDDGYWAPMGYTTNLANQGPAARVVYTVDHGSLEHIEELSIVEGGTGWSATDLTEQAEAPPVASAPMGYTTNLANQGPAARVVYKTDNGDVEELSIVGGNTRWSAADLTPPGAPKVGLQYTPMGYTTNLKGQGPAARVVYGTGASDIEELSLTSGGTRWSAADLSIRTGLPGNLYGNARLMWPR